MSKLSLITAALLLLPMSSRAADLTALETRWLRAASPVLLYSQQIKLPLDIIVQPLARAGDVPLAMGFSNGRCKLVLSMRGNPDAEAVLANVPQPEQALLIEAMTAHEMAHCWRYVHGVWHSLPAGFVEAGEERADSVELLEAARAMRETRREEGFSDLAALAWTQRHHPEQYGRVYAWLDGLRSHQSTARGGHDTRAWVRLARDGKQFEQGATPFDAVGAAWSRGLLSDE